MPQGNEVVNCEQYYDVFFRCVTMGNQLEHYYRRGNLDGCEGTISNIYTCLKAKTQSDPELAREVIRSQIKRSQAVPEPVWKLKENPGWQ